MSEFKNQLKNSLNVPVFFTSTFFIFTISIFTAVFPKKSEVFFRILQNWLIENTSWFYILSVGLILFFTVWLMFSRLGDIRLGPDHSTPDYSQFSWFAMLFSAGMGIGLLFFGVAEPIMHYASPPAGVGLTSESAREALKITFFHWGLHAWAVYAIVAITLAYFSFRKDLPLLPRSALYPLLGDRIHGRLGDIIDTTAVIGTMFGVATSLGLGVTQINAGLEYLFQIPQSSFIQICLIAAITLAATVSVVLGLDGGIKRLSNINLSIAFILLTFVFIVGPSNDLLRQYVQNTGAYLSDIVYKTFNLYAYEKKESWIGGWTLLYWGWWVSWAPFVGMFIARISRGRTIREFLIGVLFLPSGFTFLWMTIFGNSAIYFAGKENGRTLVEMVEKDISVSLFKFFEFLPYTNILSMIGLVLIVTFFVSSSDSGSLVIDTLASGGKKEPPVWQRVYWAVLEGVVASVLLLAGGVEALQTMTIASSFPMLIFILLGTYCLFKSLKEDQLLSDSVQNHTTVVQYSEASSSWKKRLDSLVKNPNKSEVSDFLNKSVRPALEELEVELKQKKLEVKIEENSDNFIEIVIKDDNNHNFSYGVKSNFSSSPRVADGNNTNYSANVFLSQGGQDYDVFGYTKEQIIADFITHYEKHLHYINNSLSIY